MPERAYQFSKRGLIRLCERRATAWGAVVARILSISPGLIATPMGARSAVTHPEREGLIRKAPLQREGTMLEVAEVVHFLTSSGASFITGVDLLMDGGLASASRR
jgi:NAD(P)-dependent dehydrogenase (short-subunit alcohol dehydrogenase family)